jgi:hypothetical protein
MVGVDPEHYVTESGSGAEKMRLRPAEPTDTVVAHLQGGSVGSLTIVSTKANPTRRTRNALAALEPKSARHGVLTLVPRPVLSPSSVRPSAQATLPRPREHKATGGRGAHAPPEDDPDPPPRRCACGCGDTARPNSKYATDLCGNRLRVYRHRRHVEEAEKMLLERCPALIHEEAVVAAIAGGMEPEDGLLWALFPTAMRTRACVRAEAA